MWYPVVAIRGRAVAASCALSACRYDRLGLLARPMRRTREQLVPFRVQRSHARRPPRGEFPGTPVHRSHEFGLNGRAVSSPSIRARRMSVGSSTPRVAEPVHRAGNSLELLFIEAIEFGLNWPAAFGPRKPTSSNSQPTTPRCSPSPLTPPSPSPSLTRSGACSHADSATRRSRMAPCPEPSYAVRSRSNSRPIAIPAATPRPPHS